MEVSSAFLKRAAQSLIRLQNSAAAPVREERPYGLSRLRAGLRLRLPVYPHLSLRRLPIAAGLLVCCVCNFHEDFICLEKCVVR